MIFLGFFDIFELLNLLRGNAMKKIIKAEIKRDYQIKLEYDDGKQGIVDLSHLVGKGVFAFWNNYEDFKNVKIGSSGELVWSDQVDLCPDSLYLNL